MLLSRLGAILALLGCLVALPIDLGPLSKTHINHTKNKIDAENQYSQRSSQTSSLNIVPSPPENLSRATPRPVNLIPQYVLCSGPQGQDPIMYTRGEIQVAVERGLALHELNQQVGQGHYPHPFESSRGQLTDTSIGNVNNQDLLLFPLFRSNFPYGTDGNPAWQNPEDAGRPGADRVLFDTSGRYAGTMTHLSLDDNNLRFCHEVNYRAEYIETPGVPGQNPDPPTIHSYITGQPYASQIIHGPGGLFPGSGPFLDSFANGTNTTNTTTTSTTPYANFTSVALNSTNGPINSTAEPVISGSSFATQSSPTANTSSTVVYKRATVTSATYPTISKTVNLGFKPAKWGKSSVDEAHPTGRKSDMSYTVTTLESKTSSSIPTLTAFSTSIAYIDI